MGMIPGKFINGKFKPLCDMTTEELEKLVYGSEIKKYFLLLAIGIFIGLVVMMWRGT